jgi:Asp-tRNA(Asn)/Glu-tRNA(Gln) amidotransferase B subunit
MQWETVIGIETHAQLSTVPKMIDAAHQCQTVTGWCQSVPEV